MKGLDIGWGQTYTLTSPTKSISFLNISVIHENILWSKGFNILFLIMVHARCQVGKETSLNLCLSACLISLATNMLEGWFIWKVRFIALFYSTQTLLYKIRELNNKVYWISRIRNNEQFLAMNILEGWDMFSAILRHASSLNPFL